MARTASRAAKASRPDMPGFTAPKLLWVRTHEPEVHARTRRVLLPKDWLRLQLTGHAVSEMSDAAGTGWLDVSRRDWSDTLLGLTGLLFHLGHLVEHGPTTEIFTNPREERTKDYITGRYG